MRAGRNTLLIAPCREKNSERKRREREREKKYIETERGSLRPKFFSSLYVTADVWMSDYSTRKFLLAFYPTFVPLK